MKNIFEITISVICILAVIWFFDSPQEISGREMAGECTTNQGCNGQIDVECAKTGMGGKCGVKAIARVTCGEMTCFDASFPAACCAPENAQFCNCVRNQNCN